MLDWSLLCKLGVGSTVDVLEGGIALEDGVYKISDSKYLLADIFLKMAKRKSSYYQFFGRVVSLHFVVPISEMSKTMTWPNASLR